MAATNNGQDGDDRLGAEREDQVTSINHYMPTGIGFRSAFAGAASARNHWAAFLLFFDWGRWAGLDRPLLQHR